MKNREKMQKLKKTLCGGRFFVGVMLFLVIFPGIVFTKRVVKADEIDLVSEEEFQKIYGIYAGNGGVPEGFCEVAHAE